MTFTAGTSVRIWTKCVSRAVESTWITLSESRETPVSLAVSENSGWPSRRRRAFARLESFPVKGRRTDFEVSEAGLIVVSARSGMNGKPPASFSTLVTGRDLSRKENADKVMKRMAKRGNGSPFSTERCSLRCVNSSYVERGNALTLHPVFEFEQVAKGRSISRYD